MKIDPTYRIEYQKNCLERRHAEVDTRFCNFRIDNLEADPVFYFVIDGYAWLWLMVVQWLHQILKMFLIFRQHAPRMDIWDLIEDAKALCRAVEYLYQIWRKTTSAVVRVVHQALEVISAVHCQRKKWNQEQSKRKQGLTFKKVSFQLFFLFILISSSRIWNEFINFSDLTSEKDDLSN